MSKNYEALLDMDDPLDTAQSQLEFQNFVLNSAEQNLVQGQVGGASSSGARASAANPPATGNITQTKVTASEFIQPQQPMTNNTSTSAFWTLQFYAQFFDVDSSDVAQRIIAALIPRSGFMDKISSNPDLYGIPTHISKTPAINSGYIGPFWIPTTVIFSLFVTSFIAGSINAYFSNTSADYVYDMALLSFASTAVYTYVAGTSAALWAVGKYFACPVKILEVFGLIGYGMSIWVPLLCILPSDFIRTILVIAAFSLTSFFFVQNITPFYANATNPAGKTVALSVIVVANAALALAFRFGFFAFVHTVNSGGGGTGNGTGGASESSVRSGNQSVQEAAAVASVALATEIVDVVVNAAIQATEHAQ
ncbi:UNVERIFIED_CONTAM: hypothetical protein HDU68_004558 [Siphonaria sp. JEL0065]|nr:hypothetical protein HDU68_004558 [Siphonaria sp. JEL0065]